MIKVKTEIKEEKIMKNQIQNDEDEPESDDSIYKKLLWIHLLNVLFNKY